MIDCITVYTVVIVLTYIYSIYDYCSSNIYRKDEFFVALPQINPKFMIPFVIFQYSTLVDTSIVVLLTNVVGVSARIHVPIFGLRTKFC